MGFSPANKICGMLQVMQLFFLKIPFESLSLLSFIQDVKKTIFDDMTIKGNEGKLNSFEQVSAF